MRIVHFEPNRTLLNPSFEGYKLAVSGSASEGPSSKTIELPQPANDACTILDNSNELQVLAYRMNMNALFTNPSLNEALYFTSEQGLWRVEFGEEEICELVVEPPLNPGDLKHPSLAFVSGEEELVILLRGAYHCLELLDRSSETVVDIPLPRELQDKEFLSIAATRKDENSLKLVLVTLEKLSPQDHHSTFRCFLLEISLTSARASILSVYHSNSRPVVVHLDGEGITLGSLDPFRSESAPILPAVTVERKNAYRWEQDEDNIYVTIDIPDSRSKVSQVSITAAEVKVVLNGETILLLETPSGEIVLDESTWSTSEQSLLITLKKGEGEGNKIWSSPWRSSWETVEGERKANDHGRDLDIITFVHYDPPNGQPKWKSSEVHYLGPLIRDEIQNSLLSTTISYGDDGLGYVLRDGGQAEHVLSFDALYFIVTGKQNRRYTIFTGKQAIIVESSKHIYIYDTLTTIGIKQRNRRQFLISIDEDREEDSMVIGWSIKGKLLLLLTRSHCHLVTLP